MKCIALFLVLSLVVLMAEPGEGFFHHIFGGHFHHHKHVPHGCIGKAQDQQEQLAKRSFDADPQDDAPQDDYPSFN
ncbi:pteroicidin-alpha-like [Anarhichas minor]|uniref:pteroicidin-alpha-like n=1 Tax=Anarhichas minor TaxID=65739 RepID=UPI003F73F1A7